MSRKVLASEGEQQKFLDLANLLPRPGFLASIDRDYFWYREDPEEYLVHFEEELDERFSPELRKYLTNSDQRWSPRQRLDWLTTLNKMLRAIADNRYIPIPWPNLADWKPTAICAVCRKLFCVTRKDRVTCGKSCANVHRQREWKRRQEDGKKSKAFELARKNKQARGRKKR